MRISLYTSITVVITAMYLYVCLSQKTGYYILLFIISPALSAMPKTKIFIKLRENLSYRVMTSHFVPHRTGVQWNIMEKDWD